MPTLLEASFAALADPTRRGILKRLGRANASVEEHRAEGRRPGESTDPPADAVQQGL